MRAGQAVTLRLRWSQRWSQETPGFPRPNRDGEEVLTMPDRARSSFFSSTRLLTCLTLLFLLPGCFTVRAVPELVVLSAPTIELPVERAHGVFFVEAMIEGRGPYRLILDTGAGMLTLSPKVVSEVGLAKKSYPWRLRGASGSKWGWLGTGRVAELSIGDSVRIDSFRFVEHSLPLEVDGLLGNGIFDHCAMVIDPLQQRIWLTTDETISHPDDVPLRLSNGVPTVALTLGDRTLRATFDSGCSGTLDLPESDEDRLALEPGGGIVETYSIHGAHWLSVRRYDGSIEIGPVSIEHPFVRFGAGHPLAGLPLFRGHALRIDLRTMTLKVGASVTIPPGVPEHPPGVPEVIPVD